MNAARYQQIQDMREPRTKRSEFRSGKLEYRAPTKINVAPEPTYGRRHDDVSPMKVAIAASLVGAIVGELPTGAVAGIGSKLLAGSYYSQTIDIWAALVAGSVLAALLVAIVVQHPVLAAGLVKLCTGRAGEASFELHRRLACQPLQGRMARAPPLLACTACHRIPRHHASNVSGTRRAAWLRPAKVQSIGLPGLPPAAARHQRAQ